MYCKPSCLIAMATGFISTAVAQSFTQPLLSDMSGAIVQYTPGQQVQIAWTSPWEYTLLDVLQGEPSIYHQLANASSSTTSYTWTVQALDDTIDLSTQTFFFRLLNGTDPNDQTPAYVDSGNFAIADAVASSTNSSAPATSTTPTSTSSSAAATSPASTTDSNVPAVAVTNTADNIDYTSSYLGVGLGLGIPFLLAIVAAAVIFIRNKRKAKRAAAADTEMSSAPAS